LLYQLSYGTALLERHKSKQKIIASK